MSIFHHIRRVLLWFLAIFALLGIVACIAAGVIYHRVSRELPDAKTLRSIELHEPLQVFSSDGRLIAIFGESRRYPVKFEDVPQEVKNAFLVPHQATELILKGRPLFGKIFSSLGADQGKTLGGPQGVKAQGCV